MLNQSRSNLFADKQFPLQIEFLKVNSKLNWRIFIFAPLALMGKKASTVCDKLCHFISVSMLRFCICQFLISLSVFFSEVIHLFVPARDKQDKRRTRITPINILHLCTYWTLDRVRTVESLHTVHYIHRASAPPPPFGVSYTSRRTNGATCWAKKSRAH